MGMLQQQLNLRAPGRFLVVTLLAGRYCYCCCRSLYRPKSPSSSLSGWVRDISHPGRAPDWSRTLRSQLKISRSHQLALCALKPYSNVNVKTVIVDTDPWKMVTSNLERYSNRNSPHWLKSNSAPSQLDIPSAPELSLGTLKPYSKVSMKPVIVDTDPWKMVTTLVLYA